MSKHFSADEANQARQHLYDRQAVEWQACVMELRALGQCGKAHIVRANETARRIKRGETVTAKDIKSFSAEAIAALDALDRRHGAEKRDFEDAIREIRRGAQVQITLIATLNQPRAALALRDLQALEFWRKQVADLDDAAFVALLEGTQGGSLTTLDEWLALDVVRDRLIEIRASRQTELRRRLRTLLMPPRVGRKPKTVPSQLLVDAKKFMGRVMRRLQNAQLDSNGLQHTYRSLVTSIVEDTNSDLLASERENLVRRVATLAVNPHKGSAYIAKARYPTIALRRLLAGPTPKPTLDKRRGRTLRGDILQIEHAIERRRRGYTDRKRNDFLRAHSR